MASYVTPEDNVTIAYRVEGAEGGRDLLLIHGWMTDGRVFDPLLAALDLGGLRCVIPDLRGAGASDKPAQGYSLEGYATDLEGLVEELASDSLIIVGHSMGGQIAQLLAAKLGPRVAGLMLLNTVPASGIPLPEDAQGLFRGATSRAPQGTILGMACKSLSDDHREALLNFGETVADACISEAFDAWMRGGSVEHLAAITAPTLVVATDDPFLPPDFLRKAVVEPIPRARLAYLPGPGHYPQVEHPAATAALLDSFLAGLGIA